MEPADPVARRAAAARVLGVAPDASPAEVRRAYRTAVKRTHPDLHPTGRIEEFVRVHEAFEDLVRMSPLTNGAVREETAPPVRPAEPNARMLVLDPTVRARIDRFVSVRTSTAPGSYEHRVAGRLDVVA